MNEYMKIAKELANENHIILLCGHYEGIDQRVIDKIVDDEKRSEYMERVIENNRMIRRIGNEQSKEAMKFIKEEYEKN